jgi:hypothetical protein
VGLPGAAGARPCAAVHGHVHGQSLGRASHSPPSTPRPRPARPGALITHVRHRRAGAGSDSGSDAGDALLPPRLAPAPPADGAGPAAGGARPKTPGYDSTSVPPVTLEWSSLGYEIALKGGAKKTVLQGVRGSAAPGRLLAIM